MKSYSEAEIRRMVAAGDHAQTALRAKQAGPALGRAFWDNARVVMPAEASKVPISLRVDAEVLNWFKGGGKGYLTRMNAVLRAYVEAHKAPHA